MNKHRAAAILSLALLLLLACTATADGAFTFRSGVTWDTAVEDMMAAEGVRERDANFHTNTITDQFTRYYIVDKPDGTEDAFYVYQGNVPVLMYYILLRDTKAVPVYNLNAEAYTQMYGAPTAYSEEEIYALLHVIWGERTVPEDYERVTAWRLSDGTLAALLTVRGDTVMMYIHEARVLAAAN